MQFDGVGTNSEDRVTVMGATNRPQELDEAARRRLVKRIYVRLPNKETRKEIIRKLLEGQNHSISSRGLTSIANATDNYSASDLTALCKDASLGPIRELGDSIRNVSPSQVRPVTLKDFQNSLSQIRPSVSMDSLKAYELWNQQFGSIASC
jgi:spastin